MSLIHHLFQEIDDAEKREGEKQCFISHEFHHRDLRTRLERALTQLGLCAYFADKELSGGFILHKVCKKILITRASIVDLTSANPNVYFELGVAIGLNKPVFIVLKQHATVPTLLENFVKLRFTSYADLERDLVTQAPDWLKESVEHHLLYNTHCHFANLLCPDRQRFTPRRRYLVIDQIAGTDAAGQPHLAPDPDLRDELPEALNRFHFTPIFLDEVQPGVGFRLCDYCRTLRDSDFALVHLTRRTTPNAYLLLGLVTGLGIPSLLLHRKEHDRDGFAIPSMLQGLDRFEYISYTEISEKLAESVEGFLHHTKRSPKTGYALGSADTRKRKERAEQNEMIESTARTNPDGIVEDVVRKVERQERERMRNILQRSVSSSVAEHLLSTGQEFGQPTEYTVIVLLADLRGFTAITERVDPTLLIDRLLNPYFTTLTEVLYEYNGTVDKLLGDGMIGVFGVPIAHPDDPQRALRAAVHMQCAFTALNTAWQTEFGFDIGMGMGMSYGRAIVGNIGSKQRLDYTLIGDAVNLASRLSSIAKAGQIIVSEHLYNALPAYSEESRMLRPLGEVPIKGKQTPQMIYEVLYTKS